MRWPNRTILLLGIGGNLAIVSLYLLTSTVGIPFFGPHAGELEGVSFTDLCATTSELWLIVAPEAVLLRDLTFEGRRLVLLFSAVALISVGHVAHLLLR